MGRVQNGWIVTSAEVKAQRERAIAKRLAKTQVSPLALEDHLAECQRKAEGRGVKFTPIDAEKAAREFIEGAQSEKLSKPESQTKTRVWIWIGYFWMGVLLLALVRSLL